MAGSHVYGTTSTEYGVQGCVRSKLTWPALFGVDMHALA